MGSYFSKSKHTDRENLEHEIARLRALNVVANAKIDALQAHLMPANPAEATCLEKIKAAKKSNDYENLVFEGGGTKGLAYCGALRILHQKGILAKIRRYAGSSAGAITAALLAVGYSAQELEAIVSATDFGAFVDDKTGILRDTYSIFKDWGLAPGDYFYRYMGDLIGSKTGNPDISFGDLQKRTGKILVITGTDLSCMRTSYYCPSLTPTMSVRQAVRISMSIPFLFVPVRDEDGCYHVDGGLVDNYPIHAFDGAYPGDERALLNLALSNPKTLGLKILTPEEEVGHAITVKPQAIGSIKEFAMAIVSTLMVANERKHLKPSYWKRTLVIKVGDFPLTKFDLSQNEKLSLVQAGIKGADRFFEKE